MRHEISWTMMAALTCVGCLGPTPVVDDAGGPPLCGGKDCLGGACVADACQPVELVPYEEGLAPSSLDVDPEPEGFVFFTTYKGGHVKRVRKDGSDLVTLVDFVSGRDTLDVKHDGNRVYVTTFDGAALRPVYALDDDGTNVHILGDKSFSGPWALAFDAEYVYWTTRYDDAEIVRAPKAGGPHEVILHKEAGAQEELYGLVLEGEDLYFDRYPLHVGRMPKAGGLPVAVSNGGGAGLAVDATHVYWAETAAVWRTKKDGSGSREFIADANLGISISIDDGYLYFTHFGNAPNADGAVLRWKIETQGPVETVASEQLAPSSVKCDAQAVYWTNQSGGVMKIAK